MTDYDLLFEFSEWLDSQGLIAGETPNDKRSHEDFVRGFFVYRNKEIA